MRSDLGSDLGSDLARIYSKYAVCSFYAIVLLVLALLLGACDGGIFGTGDGDDLIADPAAQAPSPTSPSPDTEGDASPENPTDPPPDATPVQPTTGFSTNFENTLSVLGNDRTLLRIVHADSTQQDSIVVTLNDDNNKPLLPPPGLFFLDGVFGYVELASGQGQILEFFLTEDFRAGNANPIAVVDPMDVVAGSVSTMVLRGSTGSTSTPLRILPATTEVSGVDGLSRIRVVHAASMFSENGSLDIYILGNGETTTDTTATLSSLSYENDAVSDYVAVSTGLFDMVATRANDKEALFRITLPVSLASQQVWTLVLRDDPAQGASILAIEDSATSVE